MNNYTKPYPSGVCVVDLRELITPFLSFIDQLPCSTAVIFIENLAKGVRKEY